MNTDAARMSAKIYQFPPRGRLAAGSSRAIERKNIGEPERAAISFGSAWYHEAAIQEERARKS